MTLAWHHVVQLAASLILLGSSIWLYVSVSSMGTSMGVSRRPIAPGVAKFVARLFRRNGGAK